MQQFTEIFCKAFQLKYKAALGRKRTTLKKLFRKSPLIKHSGIEFQAQTLEMKTAVVGMGVPTTAAFFYSPVYAISIS